MYSPPGILQGLTCLRALSRAFSEHLSVISLSEKGEPSHQKPLYMFPEVSSTVISLHTEKKVSVCLPQNP
ncbi:hypothetical protein EVA_14795 [gut metagenome]|uniref:Uncharacterized protein n=1 Tax=gut metagenome TaxID=749906 RepID=J9G5N1_9ZZZZ